MEPESQDREAVRRGIAFPEEIALLKPIICSSEQRGIIAAATHHLQRQPEPSEMGLVTTKRIEEIDGCFVFFDAECIGLVGRYYSKHFPETFIFTPPPLLEGETEDDE
jgi:hypothetical protein